MKGLIKLFRGKCRKCEAKDEQVMDLRIALSDIIEHTTCSETRDVAGAYLEESYKDSGCCPHGFKDWDNCSVCCH